MNIFKAEKTAIFSAFCLYNYVCFYKSDLNYSNRILQNHELFKSNTSIHLPNAVKWFNTVI